MKQFVFSILSRTFGGTLIKVLPQKYIDHLREESISWGFANNRNSILDKIMMRIIRPYFWKEYYEKTDAEIRKINRSHYWGSVAGKLWHEEIRKKYSSPEYYQNEFIKRRENMTTMLEEFIDRFPGKYEVLCEIGTGNGLYIHYLYNRNPNLFTKWIGIDLNEEQININEKIFESYAIQFVSGEVIDWMSEKNDKNTLFLTAGTLEYFTQAELEEFFWSVKRNYTSGAIAMIEPVSFDLEKQTQSAPRGSAMFNHNYFYLLQKAGYNIYGSMADSAEPSNPKNKSRLLSIIAYS